MRNLGAAWLGGFGPGPLLRLQSSCHPGLQDPLPMWLTRMAGKLVLVIGQGPQFLSLWASPRAAWVSLQSGIWLPPEEAFQEAKVEAAVHFILPSCCWLHRASPDQCGRGYSRAWALGSEDLWGHVGGWLPKAVCHNLKESFKNLREQIRTELNLSLMFSLLL